MRIGIVVPAYNAAAWIGDAIGSALSQTHTEWTMAIVDDGSADGTAEVVGRFADPRIRLLRQSNAGVSVARNRGATEVRADAVLFLDADDWLVPDALARLAQALDANPGAVAACGPYAFVPDGVPAGLRPVRARRAPGGDLLQRLLKRNLFANGGHVLVRAEAIAAAGPFRPGMVYGEDWEFFVRLAMQGTFAPVRGRRPLLFVRRRVGGACIGRGGDLTEFRPCMDAVFGNETLAARLGAECLAALRAAREAENLWVAGRALLRSRNRREGQARLRRSLIAQPSLKRAALALAAHLPLAGPS